MQVVDESLTLIDSQNISDNRSSEKLYFISLAHSKNGVIFNTYEPDKEEIEKKNPNPKPSLGNLVKNIPFYNFDNIEQIMIAQSIVPNILKNIFILNPIPSQMRNYSPLSKKLERDGSNIAGVLAALPEKQKAEVE